MFSFTSKVSYGATDTIFNDKRRFPYFFRTIYTHRDQNEAIAMLLIHFGWTWVGIMTVTEDSYERSSEDLRDRIVASGNCVAYVLKLSLGKREDMLYYKKEMDMIVKSLAKVIIVNFPTEYTLHLSSFGGVLGPMIREKVPQSTCSESCSPGYRKVIPEGNPSCCYDCIPCAEGEISNVTNMETCMTCPEEEWPNSKKDTCVRKNIDFLSSQDVLGATLEAFALLLTFMTLSVLGIFIIYRDTPIVRANNRDLSYTLLISLMLSFLCPFLFIGRPTTAICLLRQVVFSLIFTVAVSSVVAKTITVLIAFRSTKPGSKLSKWTGKKLSAFVVILCTLVELGICTWSLVQFPPFPNRDTKTYTDRIILQCIAASSIGFYTTHGYILTLSLFNFALAFLVRKLPDRFNEAHYITFSMLLFCSVWISFIPAYLSAKGKYMVAVEVFAILASSAGLFCCIFIPKCCTILLKPQLNTRVKLSVSNKPTAKAM
uniref:G-protein coupled receptors family 3 profile domain-containing protein n=1 Tax=Xenopus tropicalis TaxID=8364 RepID=A0A803K786_XENTR